MKYAFILLFKNSEEGYIMDKVEIGMLY